VLDQQFPRDVNPEIGIDADEVRVERRVMDPGERDSVRRHGLAELLVLVLDDVRCVEQRRVRDEERRRDARERSPAPDEASVISRAETARRTAAWTSDWLMESSTASPWKVQARSPRATSLRRTTTSWGFKIMRLCYSRIAQVRAG
jgi:hypothetical protein